MISVKGESNVLFPGLPQSPQGRGYPLGSVPADWVHRVQAR